MSDAITNSVEVPARAVLLTRRRTGRVAEWFPTLEHTGAQES